MPAQPIIKFLAASGAGSRRQMAVLIKAGRVEANGQVVESFTQPIDPANDKITIDGKRVENKMPGNIYLLLNKPRGIVTTTSDERHSKTVIDILPKEYRHLRLYPVGRLDKDSTGIILLTNDGDFTYRLTHPKFEREKEYLVSIKGTLSTTQIAALESGTDLEDGITSPSKIKLVNSPPFNYSITIHEGKNRQVRRMFASIGFQVMELKRIRIDTVTIAGLKDGDMRALAPREVKSLKRE